MPSAAKLQEKRDEAQHLISIAASPSWPVVKELLNQKREKEMRRMIGTAVVSQQELDFGRGMLFGFQTFIDLIEKGPAVLERTVRIAQALEGAEEE